MKLNQNGPIQGSFGIPPQMEEAAAKQRMEAESKRKKQESEPQPQPQEKPEVAEAQKKETDPDPKTLLEKIGAKFTDEDFQRLLFKGVYETELDIFKDKLKSKMKTLTAKEYEEVDELLAEESNKRPMTNEGWNSLRAILILSYGITEFNGKPLGKPIYIKDTKDLDTKSMALDRRKVLSAMAATVVNKLSQVHSTIVVAINMIVADPEAHLKNS